MPSDFSTRVKVKVSGNVNLNIHVAGAVAITVDIPYDTSPKASLHNGQKAERIPYSKVQKELFSAYGI
ncbi:hypothetical protein VP1G_11174 [Cytospora mali]|uniref:Uncharacterized protein n=1 Tax=Cytospora mali TaxID=578113 RepID=A0A194V8S1_CYTMA|nr:hypothetical protein VP1G_11174 [Valsa mali var. pyri (nom. inval.)]